MPSMMSTPKCAGPPPVQRLPASASPADAARRTAPSASPGRSARSMLAKNVGPAKNSVAPYSRRPVGDHVRSGRAGLEHRRGADRQREQHGVAEAVGEERLRRRQAPVVGGDAEHLRARRSRRRPGSSRAGASPPSVIRSCPRCTARTPASPRSSSRSSGSASWPSGRRARAPATRCRPRRPAVITARTSGADAQCLGGGRHRTAPSPPSTRARSPGAVRPARPRAPSSRPAPARLRCASPRGTRSTNAGESAMNISTRCSGSTPMARSPALARSTRSCSCA